MVFPCLKAGVNLKSDGKVIISTELDNSGLKKGVNEVSGALGGLKSVVGKLGAAIASAFAIQKIVQFGSAAVSAANELSDALTGLKSIMDGQGKSFSSAQKFIDQYTSDGLVPATNAITAYKNLALRGYNDSQIQQVMVALKDASAFGRQASYSMGEAVQSATEGLKNENSVLVDNAGVTKNVSKMWEEYAASIGTTANNLTQQQKIQAEVNGILEESKYQAGDAAKVAGTFSGQLMQLSYNFNQLKIAVGNAIIPILQVLIPALNAAIQKLIKFANAIASVISALSGKKTAQVGVLAEQNNAVASSALAGAAAEENLADATKAAGQAAKKSLASFDELNVMQDKSSGIGSGGSLSGGVSAGADLSGGFSGLASSTGSLSDSFNAILDVVEAIGATILGWKLAKTFMKGLEALTGLNVPKNVSVGISLIAAGAGLAAENIASILEGEYNATSLHSAFKEAVSGLMVGAGLTALGAGAWAFPVAIALVAGITDIVVNWENVSSMWSHILDGAKAIFTGDAESFWSEISQAYLSWMTADSWTTKISQWLADSLFGDGTWDSTIQYLQNGGSLKPAFDAMGESVSKSLEGIGQSVGQKWKDIKENTETIWSNIKTFIGNKMENIRTGITNIWSRIKTFVSDVWASIKTTASNIWTGIKTSVLNVVNGIKTGISNAFTTVKTTVSTIFTAVKTTVTNIWDGIVSAIKGAINSVIGVINGMISGIVIGLNAVIGALNKLNFSIPDWIPLIGGNSFGFNIGYMTAPKIPFLAQGAVIPPNREFMAVLGDQRHGTNVEAPLETIQEAVALVMDDYIASNTAGQEAMVMVLRDILQAVLGIQIGDSVIGEAVARYQQKMAVVKGY